MLITKVELENIKNHVETSFEFEAGVTAISGPNGAGKTTIIEAIAWVLFDQLPYKKEDFLRRGAKKGSARVTFVSAVDGREYTVCRDTGAGYYVYDPVTTMRLVEQKQQVGQWLRQHLGVEPGTDLRTLFTSTIGVPQGMLTVDFAEQPAKRKSSFDRVLRVDEYQRSSDELRAIVKVIESRDADLRERMARIEGEVAKLDELFVERSRIEESVTRISAELAAAQSERERLRSEALRLESLRQSIDALSGEAAAAAMQVEHFGRRFAELEADVRRCREARTVVEAAAAGYASYNDSYRRLQELEPQAARRDGLRQRHTEAEHQRIRLEAVIKGQREKQAEIEIDRAELARIAPLVTEQERLEARRSEIQTLLGEMSAVTRRLEVEEAELAKLRDEWRDVKHQVGEAEKLRERAQRVPALEQQRRDAEAQLRESRVLLERSTERRRELARSEENLAKLAAEIQTIEREIEAGQKFEELAAALPQLELEERTLLTAIANLQARIERDEQIVKEARGGLCPLLSEPCRNMKEGQGLDQFFMRQVGSEREDLLAAEARHRALEPRLAEAKAGWKAATVAAAQRVQRERYAQELEIERRNEARIRREVAGVTVTPQAINQMTERIRLLDRELVGAREAKTEFDKLALLEKRLEALFKQGGEKREEVAALKVELGRGAGYEEEMPALAEQIKQLGDPRGRSRLLEKSIARAGETGDQLREMENQEREIIAAARDLEKELAEFATLDLDLATQRGRRAASENDYRAYVENHPVADSLGAREGEQNRAEQELVEGRARQAELEAELDRARAGYDERQHSTVRTELESLIDRTAMLASRLSTADSRLDEVTREIDRLVSARRQLEVLGARRDRCQDLQSAADFMRDLLKKAGPFITEAHLQSISIEANHLYREITGNPMLTLRWDVGYEIVLEQDGHERSFASLSGGEQMAAALAVRLALLKELSDLRIAFFDEPTTNMDEERRRNLAQQIGRIRDFDQLFVISHDDTFEGFTDRVVAVKA